MLIIVYYFIKRWSLTLNDVTGSADSFHQAEGEHYKNDLKENIETLDLIGPINVDTLDWIGPINGETLDWIGPINVETLDEIGPINEETLVWIGPIRVPLNLDNLHDDTKTCSQYCGMKALSDVNIYSYPSTG